MKNIVLLFLILTIIFLGGCSITPPAPMTPESYLSEIKSNIKNSIGSDYEIISIQTQYGTDANKNVNTNSILVEITYYFKGKTILQDDFIEFCWGASKIFQKIFPLSNKIEGIVIIPVKKDSNEYGNPQDEVLGEAIMTRNTYNKINWAEFKPRNLDKVTSVEWDNPSFYKGLLKVQEALHNVQDSMDALNNGPDTVGEDGYPLWMEESQKIGKNNPNPQPIQNNSQIIQNSVNENTKSNDPPIQNNVIPPIYQPSNDNTNTDTSVEPPQSEPEIPQITYMSCEFEDTIDCSNNAVSLKSVGIKFEEGRNVKGILIDNNDLIEYSSNFFNKQKGTVDMWVKTAWNSSTQGAHYFFSYVDKQDASDAYRLRKDDEGGPRFVFALYSPNSGDHSVSLPANVWKTNEWNHVIAKWDVNVGKIGLEINDVKAEQSYGAISLSSEKNNRILLGVPYDYDFRNINLLRADAVIDDFKIYSYYI